MSRDGRPVRVLYVDTGVGLAGGQYSLVEILKFLDTSRFRPIVCSPPTSGIKAKCREMDLEWLPLPFESVHLTSEGSGTLRGRVRDLIRSAYGIFYITGLIRRYGIDLVHANSFKAALASSLGSLLTGRPLVFHDRVHLSHRPLDWLVGLVARRIIAVSGTVAAKHRWPLRRKVRVIPSGIDSGRITPEARRPGAPTVCYVGRISEEKCIDRLVRAARQIVGDITGVRFVIAGSPFTEKDHVYFEHIKELTEQLGLRSVFEFAGYVEDVPGLLAACDVLVLPSRKEPLGRAMLEAMAAGRPVVAYRIGGPAEVIRDGQTGILVESGSIEGLAEAIVRLLKDEPLRKRIGSRARQDVVGRFSSGPVAEGIMGVYDDILSRPG
jgi:glycosyltransferase involved in cell wall biosynthesis